MTIKEFAQSLDERKYTYSHLQFSKSEIEKAKENGFVIVYTTFDDLIGFKGAIWDESSCFHGNEVYFDRGGVIYSEDKEEVLGYNKIIVLRHKKRDENNILATWAYETNIPHETFKIWKDDELFCVGIVFSVDDVSSMRGNS